MNTIPIITTNDWNEYQLLDSGNGEKLETFGNYTMIRPDPRAIWNRKNKTLWDKADARFARTDSEHGDWEQKNPAPNPWILHYRNLRFQLHPTDFKHVGLFPEQATNWNWITEQIKSSVQSTVLNLFGYTGAATVAAARAGAHVTHVDSSKPSLTWAHENADLNEIPSVQTRWIIEDAYTFVVKEAKRGNLYNGIILDPPRFGHGPKGEIWKLTENLPDLLFQVKKILHPQHAFVLLNVYTADLSSLAIENLMHSVFDSCNGTLEIGELATKELDSERLLPQGIVARFAIK